VRSYNGRDREGVFRLLAFLPDLYPGGTDWLDRRLAEVERGRAYCNVAVANMGIAGILIDVPKGKRTSKICTLYVHRTVSGNGLGSRLLTASTTRWYSAGVDKAYVTVAGSRREMTEAFLVSSGFAQIAKLSDRYGPNRDELVYSLSLD
jgi:GNAT superfamily N-acetyltransferase